MAVAFIYTQCVNCRCPISINPIKVPSLVINGERHAICAVCFKEWNRIHRTSKGLAPIPLDPEAYSPCDESELPL